MGAIAILQMRQILGQKKIWLVALFLSLPVLLALPIRLSGGFPEQERELATGIFLYLLYPQTTSMLLALLYGTAVVNSELEGKTLTYLFTRPIPRWQLIAGKYVAILPCLAIPASASLVGCWLMLGMGGGGSLLLGIWLATLGAIAAYSAIFAAIGSWFYRRPMILGLVYAAMEIVLSFIPAIVSTLTVTYFLRSLVLRVHAVDMPAEVLRMIGGASLPGAIGAILAMIAGALALSSIAAMFKEYVLSEQV